jgi:hypothetical protein
MRVKKQKIKRACLNEVSSTDFRLYHIILPICFAYLPKPALNWSVLQLLEHQLTFIV